MKCAKYRGSKDDHASKSMKSLPIEQLTGGLWGACQAAIKWRMAVVYAWKEKPSVVRCREQWVSEIRSQWARREWRWQMIQPILWEAVPCLMFYSLFHLSSALIVGKSDLHWLIAKWSSFALPSCVYILSTCGIFRFAHSKSSFN